MQQHPDYQRYIGALKDEIAALRKERNAVILAHNYQRDEIQELADFCGDSLGLSKQAAKTDADVIVFCGVHFMAESAAILSPRKTVLLPVEEAGCPMADMIDVPRLRELKQQHPDATVVTYVNSSAAIKAESDVCCTSANAVKVVKSVDAKKIIFTPDKNLALYVSRFTDKEIIAYEGFCPTHILIHADAVKRVKAEHPKALFVAHPECLPDVIDIADYVCSTSGMYEFVKNSDASEFIIGTESGILYRLRKENPQKKFYLVSKHIICPNMKMTTLDWLAQSLRYMRFKVEVPEDIRVKAKKSLDRMLEVS
ncbi:MAG: quinolinate synthase NadA [Candidatus Abyssobacteria bacterium SURF_17]|uniref:Quinolinate synthase n=1 Tax=Candidatus Abyssobacteria bacterium SURF_17 TaxID=2093361 RepID=A0A419F7I3_9BACT|nr:MAG: quinolinate synthase NadA [Candidatus Abyssubacteria bacterium SURF_17]